MEETLELIIKQTNHTVEAYKEKTEQYFMRKLNKLIERCIDTAKISTEYEDDILNSQNTRKLREAFINLIAEYAIFHLARGDEDHTDAFFRKISEYLSSQRMGILIDEVKSVSQKLEDSFKSNFDIDRKNYDESKQFP